MDGGTADLADRRGSVPRAACFNDDSGDHNDDQDGSDNTHVLLSLPYPPVSRCPIPRIVVDPRRRHAGRKSDFFASTHDVAPTVLSMVDVPAPEAMTGVDLSRPFEGRRLPDRDYAWGGYSDSFYIRNERWALWAYNKPTGFKLFDLRNDPGQNNNVASSHPGVVKDLYGKVLARAGGRLPWYGGI